MRVFENFDAKKTQTLKLFGDDNLNNTYTFSYQNFNISSLLVENPENCFLIRVKGDSMIGAGIFNGDILLVDRSVLPKDSSIVVAEINSKLTVKKIKFEENCITLHSENPNFLPIIVSRKDVFKIWGVVRSVIKTV